MNLTRYSVDALRDLRKQIEAELASRIDPVLRQKFGVYASRVKVRECKGCGNSFTARDMRTHKCVVNWTRR